MDKEQNNKSIDGFDKAQSIKLEDEQKNQFLDEGFQYQNCPNCQRSFFMGKLKYHLKLCKPSHPMTKSSLRKQRKKYVSNPPFERPENKSDHKKIQINFSRKQQQQNKYQKCTLCKVSIPIYRVQSHRQKCFDKSHQNFNPQTNQIKQIKYKTKVDFNKNNTSTSVTTASILPRIQNSAKQRKFSQKRKAVSDLKQLGQYTVKVRQDLSCFKKALQVQQIQCTYCGRRFSREASLRHIPICEKLKLQQKHSIVLKKHSKSQLYKTNLPIKKTTLFRQKFTSRLSENNSNINNNNSSNSELQTKPNNNNNVNKNKTARLLFNVQSSNNHSSNNSAHNVVCNNNSNSNSNKEERQDSQMIINNFKPSSPQVMGNSRRQQQQTNSQEKKEQQIIVVAKDSQNQNAANNLNGIVVSQQQQQQCNVANNQDNHLYLSKQVNSSAHQNNNDKAMITAKTKTERDNNNNFNVNSFNDTYYNDNNNKALPLYENYDDHDDDHTKSFNNSQQHQLQDSDNNDTNNNNTNEFLDIDQNPYKNNFYNNNNGFFSNAINQQPNKHQHKPKHRQQLLNQYMDDFE